MAVANIHLVDEPPAFRMAGKTTAVATPNVTFHSIIIISLLA